MDTKRLMEYTRRFLKDYQIYQTYWNYEDGVVLMGCKQLAEATGEESFMEYMIHYLETRVTPEGTIPTFKTEKFNIDSMNCGKVLFAALDRTGDERYKKALDFHMEVLAKHPRCKCGSFWHKEIYPNQIWLDGLYMAQPLYMEYETRFHNKENYNDIIHQFENVQKYLYDPEKKLYYHGYDESRQAPWANKETGCSANFWSRAYGWWLMALIDTMDVMSEQIYEHYRTLEDIFRIAVKGLLPHLDPKDHMVYQVIDHPEAEGNYTETSGSAMAAYAIMKGCRLGVLLPEKYLQVGRSMFEGIVENKLRPDENGIDKLYDICHVAGLGPGEERDGSVAYYLSEPKSVDEAKGVGPFLMAFGEYLKTSEE
ncbi:MAG: glycoside hydrolase family 88 protein [Lachnospiraceae bacterium]|nr:glycoside hydrolase family 88 protein [Lachnospiraceae bacterium]